MRKLRPFLVLLALTTNAAPSDLRVSSHELPSGIRVVLVPNAATDAIAIHLTFDAGSRLDRPSREGTAWLASRVIGSRLAGFEASLNQERSVFTASATHGEIADVFARIRAVLSGQAVSDAELTRARSEARPDQRAEELLLRLVYDDRPHGHRAEAEPVHVRSVDVSRFIREHYGPGSAVLAVAGSFDEQSVLAAIREALAPLPAGRPKPRCRPYAVRLQQERSRVLDSSTPRQIDIGYPTAAAPTADWFALNILADILGQGPDSRLQQKLVAGGLATEFLEGETESPCTSSLLRMRVRLAGGVEPAAVLTALDEELRRLGRELVTDAELAKAKEQERQWHERQIATAAGAAGAAARAALFYGDATRATTDVARMHSVTAEDARRVARDYLQASNRGVVISVPPVAAAVREAVAASARDTFSGAVIVTHGSNVLFAEAYGRANALSSCFDIASLGKMFTGVAVAQLVEQGRLRFDAPIDRSLPKSLSGWPIGQQVTLAQLLTHRSGIPDLPEDLFNAPPESLQGYVPFFTSVKLDFEPGAQRSYSNAGFVLLGMIVESVSGQGYADYVRRNVFERAGMEGVVLGRTAGPHGGACVAAPELVKFFDALRSGKLLKPETAKRVTTSSYGFGTLEFATDRLVGHSGGTVGVSADAYTYWQSGYTVVVLSDLGPPASHDVARAIRRVIEAQF